VTFDPETFGAQASPKRPSSPRSSASLSRPRPRTSGARACGPRHPEANGRLDVLQARREGDRRAQAQDPQQAL